MTMEDTEWLKSINSTIHITKATKGYIDQYCNVLHHTLGTKHNNSGRLCHIPLLPMGKSEKHLEYVKASPLNHYLVASS